MTFPVWVLYAERLAWSGLTALGLLFLFLALRMREDRELDYLGRGIVLICLVVAPDIWIPFPPEGVMPGPWPTRAQNAQQIAALVFVWNALRFTWLLTGRPAPSTQRAHAVIMAAFGAGFLVNASLAAGPFLVADRGGYAASSLYQWVFAPYMVGLFGWITRLTWTGWRKAHDTSRRTLGAFSLAYLALLVGGILDFLFMIHEHFWALPSASVLAAIALGGAGTYLFTSKVLRFYEERKAAVLKIAAIDAKLGPDAPLGELGKSAERISETIRSFAGEMKSDAEALRRDRAPSAQTEVARIENARRRLETFTTGILDYSRSARSGERTRLAPSVLAAECLSALPAEYRERVSLTGIAPTAVDVDLPQMRRAVAALVRNAFEAGAVSVEFRLSEGSGRLSLVVEDDGPGVPFGETERISTPFYTTRKREGAPGLGASIAAGVFAAHGGSLSFHPSTARGGLLVNGILPAWGAEPTPPLRAAPIVICEDGTRIARVLRACSHIGLTPSVRGFGELASPRIREPRVLLVDAGAGDFPEAAREAIRAAARQGAAGNPVLRFLLPGDAPIGAPRDAWWLYEETLLSLADSMAGFPGGKAGVGTLGHHG